MRPAALSREPRHTTGNTHEAARAWLPSRTGPPIPEAGHPAVGPPTGTQTDLRMEPTGTGDLPDLARSACGDRSGLSRLRYLLTNKPHRLRQRVATYSTAAGKAACARGGERGITGKSRPPGLIAERIELQAVPPPYTMSPGSRRHIGSPPLRLPGLPAASPDVGPPVDVRRLGPGAGLRHRQNYVCGYVSEQG